MGKYEQTSPDAVSDEIHRILRRYLGADAELRASASAADIKTWTSLNHTKILLSLEEVFDFSFSNKEISNLKNIGDLIDLVTKKLNS